MSERSGNLNQIPASIAAVLGSRTGKTDGLGKSGAQVLLFDNYVLKIRPAESWDTADVRVLEWLDGKAPVPRMYHPQTRPLPLLPPHPLPD